GTVWTMGGPGALGRYLDSCQPAARLAALYGRTLGLHRRLGLVLGRRRRRGRLGPGDLSLWSLGLRRRMAVDLDSGGGVGAGLGAVAAQPQCRRLGAAASRRARR